MYFGGGEGETLVKENNLGWVASVENYEQLNYQIQQISKMDKSELFEMKKRILLTSQTNFNLDFQMNYLIENNVF
jgi:hypothetical protein